MSICTISGVKVCTVFGVYSTFLSNERALSDVHPETISSSIAKARVETAGMRANILLVNHAKRSAKKYAK